MKRIAFCLLLIGMGLGLSPAANAAPIIVNGGFETPVVGGPYVTVPPGTPPTGWNAQNVDHIGTYWPGYGGTGQSVDLNGTGGAGLIWQQLNTVVGQEYEVSFALSRNSDNGTGVLQAGAAVFPDLTEFGKAIFSQPYTSNFQGSFNTPSQGVFGGAAYDPAHWTLHDFRFTATTTTSVLVFGGSGISAPGGSSFGPELDAVSITETPAQACLAVWGLLSAAGAVYGYRRRRLAKPASEA